MKSLETNIRRGVLPAALLAVVISVGCGAAPAPSPTSAASPGQTPAATPAPSNPASTPTAGSATPDATPGATPTPAPTDVAADPHEVILSIETQGGRCVGGPCTSAVLFDRDGRVHAAAKPPNELGFVSADKMADLQAAIAATDFAEVFSHPFTGECPTAYDGQELVFEFLTPDSVQRVASCTVDVDYDTPLFAAVKAAVAEFVPQLQQ